VITLTTSNNKHPLKNMGCFGCKPH